MPDFVQLPGTAHELTPAEASRTSALGALSDEQGGEAVEVTLLIRENPAGPALPETIEAISAQPVGWRLHLTHDELASAHGCTAEDVELVSDWARRAGLTVGATDPATRRVKLRGTVAQMAAAFRVEFERLATSMPGGTPVTYRHHRGPASIPAALEGIVEHVGGLSDRPVARARYWVADPASVQATYTPEQLAAVYQFPAVPAGGAGLTLDIGIAELGGRADQAVVGWFTKANSGSRSSRTPSTAPCLSRTPGARTSRWRWTGR